MSEPRARYATGSLVDRARLTKVEIGAIIDRYTVAVRAEVPLQGVADAATAKALWAVMDWLLVEQVDDVQGARELRAALGRTLTRAGIERLKREVTA